LDDVLEEDKPPLLGGLCRLDKLVVEVVGADGVGKLAEIHLEERRHRVDVLQDSPVTLQAGNSVLVKSNSESLNVGGDSTESVDAVDHTVCLDEVGAMDEDFGHWLARVEQVL